MIYCSMQKQLIADYTLRRRELREDEAYMETEVTQGQVDKIKLRLALNAEQSKCETINLANATASETLVEMLQMSSIIDTFAPKSLMASDFATA